MSEDKNPDTEPPKENILHFNPWRDFNDAAPQVDVFGDEPDPEQIAQFLDVVFGYCDGLIPVRGFIDKGQGFDGRPHNIWIEADAATPEKLATFATWASREGAAVYVIPGTVAEPGQAKRPRSCGCRPWSSISTPATSPPSATIWSATSARRPWWSRAAARRPRASASVMSGGS